MISTITTERTTATPVGRPLVSWGAIFAGWLVGNAIMMLLMNLGSALGFSAADAVDVSGSVDTAQGFAVGAAVWTLATWSVSFYLAGLFAGWLAGSIDRIAGAIHGLCVWALAGAFALFLAAVGVTGGLVGGSLAAAGIVKGAGQAEETGFGSSAIDGIRAELKEQVSNAASEASREGGQAVSRGQARRAIEQVDQETLGAAAGQLFRGDTNAAKNTLVARTSLDRAQVDSVVAGMSQRLDEAKAQAAEAGRKAADASQTALWALFFTGLVTMTAAGFGGFTGARGYPRFFTRRYENL